MQSRNPTIFNYKRDYLNHPNGESAQSPSNRLNNVLFNTLSRARLWRFSVIGASYFFFGSKSVWLILAD